ncbi:hypothetical protein [Prosthecobacter sp.]|uniref:hypothetical protein n=1 Tax=Prosthecobacter sp. TaxID=1965333 RepID=UPI003784175E
MSHYPSYLSQVTQKCVSQAENALRAAVSEKYHSLNEEMITHLFWCELVHEAKKFNKAGLWSSALAQDLHSVFYQVQSHEFERDYHGLFCEVQLHNHAKEAKSGGDFGLFASLPQLHHGYYGSGQTCTIKFVDRALLVQAKLRSKGRRRPTFKDKQAENLSSNAGFSALLLYSYEDKEQKDLSPFIWQSCAGTDTALMNEWLRDMHFPSPANSTEVIDGLYREKLGTANQNLINTVIRSSSRPRIELRLQWPDHSTPEYVVELSDYLEEKEKQRIMVYEG